MFRYTDPMTKTAESRWVDVLAYHVRDERNQDWFEEAAADMVGDSESEEFYEKCLELAGF